MKIFVVLALVACAFADDTLQVGGLADHEIIPPPPGFASVTGLTGLAGTSLEGGLLHSPPGLAPIARSEPIELIKTIEPIKPIEPLARILPTARSYVDAPIYNSPPLSLVDHERVNVVPAGDLYKHHGNFVSVPPSRTQPISSPLKNYVVGTPVSGQYLYSPAPVHAQVIPSSGYNYVYSAPAVHSGVIPTTGAQYLFSPPNVHSEVIPQYGVHSEVFPATGSQYLLSPPSVPSSVFPAAVSGQFLYSPPGLVNNYYVPEVAQVERKPLLRATIPEHPRNGASVYYAKWQ